MEPGFWRSREFFVAALLAAVILTAGTAVYATSLEPAFHHERPSCARPSLSADPVPVTSVRDTDEGVERQFTVPLEGPLALIDTCVGVGRIEFQATDADEVRVTFTAQAEGSEGRQALARLDLQVTHVRVGDAAHVHAWQANDLSYRRGMFSSDSVVVDVLVQLPRAGVGTLRAETSWGDIDLAEMVATGAVLETHGGDVRVESSVFDELDARSHFGALVLQDVSVEDRATLESGHGRVDAALARVGNASLDLRSGFGDVDLVLPDESQYGFQIVATTDYGDIEFDLGPTEADTSENDHGESRREARTQGYASQPIRANATLHSDYGDIRVGRA